MALREIPCSCRAIVTWPLFSGLFFFFILLQHSLSEIPSPFQLFQKFRHCGYILQLPEFPVAVNAVGVKPAIEARP